MKLQFAFGNPRKGKRKKTRQAKSVAKRKKKTKTKSVIKRAKRKSKKRKAKVARIPNFSKAVKVAKRKKMRRKNPRAALIKKKGKIIGREHSPLNTKERKALDGKLKEAMGRYKAAPMASKAKAKARKVLSSAISTAKTKFAKDDAYQKTLARYREDVDVSVTEFDTKEKGAKVAKKKRKSKKTSTKRRKKKAVKASAPKKVKRKKTKTKRRKSRKSKKVSAAKTKRSSKRRGSKKRKSGKKRRRARMIKHSHSSAQRHIKKGTSFRFKTKAKRGKRSITVSGRVKVNPFRRNPMKNLSAQSKKYLGLDAAELGSLALGGALVPIVNAGIGKVPGADKLVAFINGYVGPQATGSIIPILMGAALNFAGDKASGQGKEYLKMAGEGLAAAGVVGLIMGLSQTYVAPALGLSGINYTPNGMRGINYTPNMGIMPQMNGINYTPAMNGMGIMPQLNGADFGSANYGGDGGSPEASTQRSDFGAWDSADSEAGSDMEDGDNSYSSSMN